MNPYQNWNFQDEIKNRFRSLKKEDILGKPNPRIAGFRSFKRVRVDSGVSRTPVKVSKLSKFIGPKSQNPYLSQQKETMAKSTSRRAQNSLTNRSSMAISGRTNTKKVKSVNVPARLRKQIKQVMVGSASKGTYSVIKTGFIGSSMGNGIVALAGDDLGKTQAAVYYNIVTRLPGRTLFNQLVSYGTGSVTGIIPGTGMNFFTPAKILDAASVLFNNKIPSTNPYNTFGNLSTFTTSSTGLPLSSNPGQLKINVLSSSVDFTMKNLSNRVVTIEIWECMPMLKFEDTNPLQSALTSVSAYSEVTSDGNFSYYDGNESLNNFDPLFNVNVDFMAIAKKYMGLKFTWKKRTMVLAPDETCVHSIVGPKGVFDFKNVFNTPPNVTGTTAIPIANLTSLYKGWSVGCLISVNGDLVLPTTVAQNEGGHAIFGTANYLSMPVAVQTKENYTIAVPEIAGFITTGALGGTQQMLNNRKPKVVVYDATALGNFSYSVSNEVNPVAEGTIPQNQ